MKKYKPRAVIVEAMQMPTEPDRLRVAEVVEWIEPGSTKDGHWTEEAQRAETFAVEYFSDCVIDIIPKEGESEAAWSGDYVVKDSEGHFSAIPRAQFERVYEEVE